MADLQSRRQSDFHHRLRQHLLQRFPRQCAELGPARLDASIADGIRYAGQFGISSERGICRFIDTYYLLQFCLGDNELSAWAGRVLSSTDLDPAAKLEHVLARVVQAHQERQVSQDIGT